MFFYGFNIDLSSWLHTRKMGTTRNGGKLNQTL